MRLAITTDTHFGVHKDSNEKVIAMLEDIATKSPDALIHCGDFGSTSRFERFWFWKIVRDIFGKDLIIGAVNGNHDFWELSDHSLALSMDEIDSMGTKSHSPADTLRCNFQIFEQFNICYIPDGLEFNTETAKIFITGFDGWYSARPHTNDRSYIPHYVLPEGRDWLRKRSDAQFSAALKDIKQAKENGATTIMVTHFGFTHGAATQDWKNYGDDAEYYGNNPNYEQFLDDTDYLFYGHSHVAYSDIANNGHTKVINVGSGYSDPRYEMFEF